jgi:hypothetical protein
MLTTHMGTETGNVLQEYCYDQATASSPKGCISLRQVFKRSGPTWRKGETIQADALQGTSLAATNWGGEPIRLYYQDTGLELKEHCCDSAGQGAGWYVGK